MSTDRGRERERAMTRCSMEVHTSAVGCAIRDCDEDATDIVVAENIIGPPSVIRLCGYHIDAIRFGEVVSPVE